MFFTRSDRKIKILTIVALVVAVACMTLGFASFSNTLNILSSATVTPNSEDFKIAFSGSATDPYVSSISFISEGGATADNGFFQDMKFNTSNVRFTEPGQKITYLGYVHNAGKYDGYSKAIEFGYVEGTESKKVCTPVDGGGATQALVDAACEGIKKYI